MIAGRYILLCMTILPLNFVLSVPTLQNVYRDYHTVLEFSKATNRSNTNWGDWGPEQFCPEGTFAKGFRLKVQRWQGGEVSGGYGDDTSLNTIELICAKPTKDGDLFVSLSDSIVGASVGGQCTDTQCRYPLSNSLPSDGEGEWTFGHFCPGHGNYIYGAQYKSESWVYERDDTAGNDVNMYCDVMNENSGMQLNGTGMDFGEWSRWDYCPLNLVTQVRTAICGLQNQIEPYQGSCDDMAPGGCDDTGHNAVKFFCCDLPKDDEYLRVPQ